MKKIAAHTGIFILFLASLSLYTYIGYRLGHSAGVNAGWREAAQEMNLPSVSEIQHLSEVCSQ